MPRETARKTVGMGVSCEGTGWLWDTRDASGGISGLSPGLTPPLATSGNTALGLSYGFVLRPEGFFFLPLCKGLRIQSF